MIFSVFRGNGKPQQDLIFCKPENVKLHLHIQCIPGIMQGFPTTNTFRKHTPKTRITRTPALNHLGANKLGSCYVSSLIPSRCHGLYTEISFIYGMRSKSTTHETDWDYAPVKIRHRYVPPNSKPWFEYIQGLGLLCKIHVVSQQGFSNMASDWLAAVLPANQMPDLKIFN